MNYKIDHFLNVCIFWIEKYIYKKRESNKLFVHLLFFNCPFYETLSLEVLQKEQGIQRIDHGNFVPNKNIKFLTLQKNKMPNKKG